MLFKNFFRKRRIENLSVAGKGEIKLFENEFYYHHKSAFLNTYKEIFEEEIYDFKLTTKCPVIIDCGANMGLSLLYYSKKFPDARIIAFEPDENVLPFLEKNIISQKLMNVELIKKGVWTGEADMDFYTDYGLGGRMGGVYKNQISSTIKTVRLKEFLKVPIEMLKIDIEGAEYKVLKDCGEYLQNVSHIFVEYHSFYDEQQRLDDLLMLLKKHGFRYHLKQSFSRNRPFVERHRVCEKYDLTINVFGYRI